MPIGIDVKVAFNKDKIEGRFRNTYGYKEINMLRKSKASHPFKGKTDLLT